MSNQLTPQPPLVQLREVAQQVRDEIMDLLIRLSATDRLTGWAQTPEQMPDIWASLHDDSEQYMFALDFIEVGGIYRLARIAAPWSMTSRISMLDPDFRQALGRYLLRRNPSAARIAVRTNIWSPGSPSMAHGIAKAACSAELDVQIGTLDAEWPDADEIDLAWIDAPHLSSIVGATRAPPDGVRLANPLWTSLLDEPALLNALYCAYPGAGHYLPTQLLPAGGLTVGSITNTDITCEPTVAFAEPFQNAVAEIDSLLRVYVDNESVMGEFTLRRAQLANLNVGDIEQV